MNVVTLLLFYPNLHIENHLTRQDQLNCCLSCKRIFKCVAANVFIMAGDSLLL